jgi:hypothetical protein
MASRVIRIAMNGVTGRLGTNQHLVNSILAIGAEGGIALADGDRLVPEQSSSAARAAGPMRTGQRGKPHRWDHLTREHMTRDHVARGTLSRTGSYGIHMIT